MTSIRSVNDLSHMVYHMLLGNRLYRVNDRELILAVCEKKGYCSHTLVNGRRAWVFYEDTDMPRSFFDTVRRTRQKLQQSFPEVCADPETREVRLNQQSKMRGGIIRPLVVL